MYKSIFIIWILLNSVEFVMAQHKNADGIYYDTKNGDEIRISGNNFYFIRPNGHLSLFYNDTLARCSFEWIDNEFIILNSIDYLNNYNNLVKNTEIIQTYDSTIAEGMIKIVFYIPIYYYTDFCIYTYGPNSSSCIINSDSMLTNNFDRFSFVLHTDIFSHKQLLVYGTQIYSSPKYFVSPACNSIKIQIKHEAYFRFFESYYVRDQYARIRNNTIYWNGDIYVEKTRHPAIKNRKRLKRRYKAIR